jgi:hypothetical protein
MAWDKISARMDNEPSADAQLTMVPLLVRVWQDIYTTA